MTASLRAGELAAAAHVNTETLRYYERRGLLPQPERTSGGQRRYPVEAITRVRVVKTAQRLGFSLTEIADLLDTGLHRHGRRSDPDLQERVAAKLVDVDRRIVELRVIRDSLQAAITAGCDDLTACAGSPCCPLPFTELVDRVQPDPTQLSAAE